MTIFVHIADCRHAPSIRRTGLRLPRLSSAEPASTRPPGVFALPVVPNFVVSHQWLRELKRRGMRTCIGVYFRVGADEPVWAGHYSEEKQRITAAQAAAHLREHGTLGYEVIVPRPVRIAEIHALRMLPQGVGWRYFPGSHDRAPCGCDYCQSGLRGGRKLRAAFQRAMRSPFEDLKPQE